MARPPVPPRIAPRLDPDEAPHPLLPPPALPGLDGDPAPAPRRPARRGRRIALGALVLFLLPPAAVLALRWVPPPTTAFMLQSPVKPVEYRWVPAARQPENLRRAVIASEDQKFWTHRGFDLDAIQEALARNQKGRHVRGASTISQQVAKNLFLWPGRSWLRKGVEATFTVLIEALWGKARILEVYLNTAEFGPGLFGAEAAAQRFFHRGAAQLTPEQCARLAAVLPNPRKWNAERPGPYVQARAQWILGQLGYRPPQPEPVAPIESPREWMPAQQGAPGPDAPPGTTPLPQEAPAADAATDPAEPAAPDLDADDLPPPAEAPASDAPH